MSSQSRNAAGGGTGERRAYDAIASGSDDSGREEPSPKLQRQASASLTGPTVQVWYRDD